MRENGRVMKATMVGFPNFNL